MRIAIFGSGRLRCVIDGDPISLAATFAADGTGPILRDLAASPFRDTPFAALVGVKLEDFDAAVRAAGQEPKAPDLWPAFIDLVLRQAGI